MRFFSKTSTENLFIFILFDGQAIFYGTPCTLFLKFYFFSPLFRIYTRHWWTQQSHSNNISGFVLTTVENLLFFIGVLLLLSWLLYCEWFCLISPNVTLQLWINFSASYEKIWKCPTTLKQNIQMLLPIHYKKLYHPSNAMVIVFPSWSFI